MKVSSFLATLVSLYWLTTTPVLAQTPATPYGSLTLEQAKKGRSRRGGRGA
jgi:hypothetical protein